MGGKLDGPAPGSQAAIMAGCQCPVIDNHHGNGVPYGTELHWVINETCPIHGGYWEGLRGRLRRRPSRRLTNKSDSGNSYS